MFKKNIKPILMAGALALATAVSPVLAEDNSNVITDKTSVDLIKTLNFADGINTINETFSYNIEFQNFYTYLNAGGPADSNANVTYPRYKVGSTAFNFDLSSTTITDPHKATTSLAFSLVNDQGESLGVKAGFYVYKLTENTNHPSEHDNDTVEYNTNGDEYTITVRVENNSDYTDTKITGIEVKNKQGKKVKQITFSNTYDETTSFTLEKNITGSGADLDKQFTFTVDLTLPNTTKIKEFSVTGDSELITDGLTSEGKLQFTDDDGNGVYTATIEATLADDDTFTINKLPAGTKYTVTEVDTEYDESYVINNGTSVDGNTTGEKTLTDTATTVTFTNTKDSSPLTGVIVNNMPYIALLGASGAGLVVLAASKKRSGK